MARGSRVIYEGAIYHIYQRGNNKEYIFEDDVIKKFFVKYLREYNKKLDYEILAYVIMNNHYHLMIRANKSPINEVMFYLNNLLGKYINNKLNRTGHAFNSRYKCRVIETDSYLIWLLRYIHRNPIKANLCNKLEDYNWSSHYYYRNNMCSHINTEFILKRLGNNRGAALKQYLKLVNSTGDEVNQEKDYELIKELFQLEETVFSNQVSKSRDEIRSNRETIVEIISKLNIDQNTLEDIRSGSRRQSITPLKVGIIKRALDECYSLKEIADHLNMAPSSISKLVSRNKII